MVGHRWTTEEQREFLSSFLDDYRRYEKFSGKNALWDRVFPSYFEQWPVPEDEIVKHREVRNSMPLCGTEQYFLIDLLIVLQKVKDWFRRHSTDGLLPAKGVSKAKRLSHGGDDIDNTVDTGFHFQPPRLTVPRQQASNVYSTLYYEKLVKGEFEMALGAERELAAAKGTAPRADIAIRQEVLHTQWAAIESSVKHGTATEEEKEVYEAVHAKIDGLGSPKTTAAMQS
jgi:hypothetical protein